MIDYELCWELLKQSFIQTKEIGDEFSEKVLKIMDNIENEISKALDEEE